MVVAVQVSASAGTSSPLNHDVCTSFPESVGYPNHLLSASLPHSGACNAYGGVKCKLASCKLWEKLTCGIGGPELNRTFESFNRITCKYHEDNTRSVAIERTCQERLAGRERTITFVGMVEEYEGVCAKCK